MRRVIQGDFPKEGQEAVFDLDELEDETIVTAEGLLLEMSDVEYIDGLEVFVFGSALKRKKENTTDIKNNQNNIETYPIAIHIRREHVQELFDTGAWKKY